MSGSPQPILLCLLISFEVRFKHDKNRVNSSRVGDKAIDLATDSALLSLFGVGINPI